MVHYLARQGQRSHKETVALAFAAIVSLCFATVSNAGECEVLTAKIVASVRGAALDKIDIPGRHVELSHPDADGLTIHCRVPADAPSNGAEIPAAISITAKSLIPSAAYFDLVGKVGSALTGRSASLVRKTAVACHQQALTEKDRWADTTIDGIYYVCNAQSWYISVQNGPPPP